MMKIIPIRAMIEKCENVDNMSQNINSKEMCYSENDINDKNAVIVNRNVSKNDTFFAEKDADITMTNLSLIGVQSIPDEENLTDTSVVISDISEEETEHQIWGGRKNNILSSLNISSDTVADDSGIESPASSWGKSVTHVKEYAFAKLEEELQNAKDKLKLRDEEVSKLCRIRQDLESELEELTASLFQEAHTMVRDANLRQLAAEKSLKESIMKVDVLTAEVSALKTLVLTSTPSRPNLHLHMKQKDETGTSYLFKKQHYRSPSNFELKSGRETPSHDEECPSLLQTDPVEVKNGFEVDPNVHTEFMSWKDCPTLEKDNTFIDRIYKEDILLCLNFNNAILSNEVIDAIHTENIFIEAVDKSKSHFPKICALMETPMLCYYRMKIGDSETWHYISQTCRNRIIAVCNFLNYLRYIQRGLVKSSPHDMYWEIIRLRKEMAFARLGLPISSESS